MSLIEEALRRAQEAGRLPERREPPAPSQPPGQPPAPETRIRGSPRATASQRSHAWPQAVLLGGGAILVVGVVVWRVRTVPVAVIPTAGPSLASTESPSLPVVQDPLSPPSPAPQQPFSQPHLELTGIVAGQGESLAIINGNIMRMGDTVGGVTLLEVHEDSARVHWQDGELVLRFPR